MTDTAEKYGRHLYEKQYGVSPDFRYEEVITSPDELVHRDASGEIWILFDVSENDQSFTIESDTNITNNTSYFKNQVPTRPMDMSGNILIDTNGATGDVVFTFIVFYS